MERNKEIDAYKYANDFEELSLDIINIIFESENDFQNIIFSDTTQQTRDRGVDAYIILKVGTLYYTYTIEAKLRNPSTLSLKDFASSILYCLINSSYKHFVVSNVRFSDETIRVISHLNKYRNKKVELIDGKKLQQIINQHLERFSNYPDELIKFIQNQTFTPIVHSVQTDSKSITNSFIVKVNSREKYRQEIESYIDEGYKLFLIVGPFGVGKYTLIKEYLANVKQDVICQEIDLSIIRSPKLLILELLRFLLGIELEELFELSSDKEDNNANILSDFQVFPNSNNELLNALNILLDKNAYSYNETIYYMNLLCNNIINQFFVGSTIVFSIINLHCATQEMINFILDFLSCLIKNGFVILLDLLNPKIQSEVKYVSLEQWYNYIQLLKNYSLDKAPVLFSIEDYSETETKAVIEQFIPIHSISTEYKQKFIEYFGTNPHDIYIVLAIIRKQKLYTPKALKQLMHQSIPQMLDKSIYRNINELNYPFSPICLELLTFLVIMEGTLSCCVFDYFRGKYSINDLDFLEDTDLFKFQNGFIHLKQSISMEIIKKYISPVQERQCAVWLSEHIPEMCLDSVRKSYFEYKLNYMRSPSEVIDSTPIVVGFLKKNQAFDLAISVRYMCYNYFKMNNENKQYYINAVEYLELLANINPYNSQEDVSMLIKEVDEMRLDMELYNQIDPDIINANIKFAFILYKKEKMNYNYQVCERHINYILGYENVAEDKSYFIKAHIYKALIIKEQGLRNEFIVRILQALRKYPNSKEIKVAYYANLAAMYKSKRLDISIKLLNIIRNITKGDFEIRGSLWTEIDLLQYRCYMGIASYDEIKRIRKKAERIASTNNLARSFNAEGYYHLKQLNMLNAKECTETAITMSLTAGESKLYFLFTLNLISILRLMRLDYEKYFYDVFSWFQNHCTEIVARLENNRNRQEDHMFSAVINLIILSQELKVSLDKLETDGFLTSLTRLSSNGLLKLVPDFFKLHDMVFVLY
jgi:hypothetical protein